MLLRPLFDDSPGSTLRASHFTEATDPGPFTAPHGRLRLPPYQHSTNLSNGSLFTLPAHSVSSLTLPPSIRGLHPMPSLYRCNVAAPFPFNAEPLLRREIRREYRHYFGLPGRVYPAHDREASGSGTDQPVSSLAKKQGRTDGEAAVGGYGQKADSGIMKRSCKWFAKKLGKLMNPFPPKDPSGSNAHRAAEGNGIRDEGSNAGRNETLSSGLPDSSGGDIDARSEMTTTYPVPPNVRLTSNPEDLPQPNDPQALEVIDQVQVLQHHVSAEGATARLIEQLKLSIAHIEEDIRKLSHTLRTYRRLEEEGDFEFVPSEELMDAIEQLPDTLLPPNLALEEVVGEEVANGVFVGRTVRQVKSCPDF